MMDYVVRNLPARNVLSVRILYHLMCVLSERYFAAGWNTGLEYSLWHAAHNIGRRRRFICRCEAGQLRKLAKRIGGWIVFDCTVDSLTHHPVGPYGPRFVSMQQWMEILAQQQQTWKVALDKIIR